MADIEIHDVPQQTGATQLKKGDLLLASRQQRDVSATWGAEAALPATTSADAGKILIVNNKGVAGFQPRNKAWGNGQLLSRPMNGPGLPLNEKINTYNDINAYLAFTIEILSPLTPALPTSAYDLGRVICLSAGGFNGVTGNTAVGNTYYFETPNNGWVSLKVTARKEIMLNGSIPTTSHGKGLRIYSIYTQRWIV